MARGTRRRLESGVHPSRSFEDWEAEAGSNRGADPLWRMAAYRMAGYALEMGWTDAQRLRRSRITWFVASQLYRALGSTVANIAEGYSRSSGPDRARLFEYALGSAREARAWYLAGRPVLEPTVVEARIHTLDRICRIMLTAIPVDVSPDPRPGG